MKLPLILLTLLSVQSMALTTIEKPSTNIHELKNKTIIKIQRELPLGRELRTAQTSRENRKTRMARSSRITREIHFVYASPKKSKPIQIAGLK